MIITKELKTVSDFKSLKKGDLVACEWHRDQYEGKGGIRFNTYIVFENKEHTSEIILNRKFNIYFNYDMFLFPEKDGSSNLKSIVLIQQSI